MRILLLLWAPLALTSLTPLQAEFGPRLAIGAALAVLSLAPLLLELGPGPNLRRAAWVALAATATPFVLVVAPPGALIASSDLATGATVVAMGAGLLVAAAVAAPSRQP